MPKGVYNHTNNLGRGATSVLIDGDAYREALKATGFTPTKISSVFLGRDKTYLSNACITGRINKDDFAKLNDMFNFKAEDYILTEESLAFGKPETQNAVDLKPLEDKIDLLIKAVEALTKVQLDIYKKHGNALGSIVQNTRLQLEHQDIDLDSIDDGISKVNSSLNVVKGRLDDISKALPKED